MRFIDIFKLTLVTGIYAASVILTTPNEEGVLRSLAWGVLSVFGLFSWNHYYIYLTLEEGQ